MKYVKYLIVVTALLVLMGFFSACGESEDVVNEMPEGLYPMCKAGDSQMWGYVDETGKWIIEPQFFSAGPFVDGLACVQESESGLCGFIDDSGDYIIEPRFSGARQFAEGGLAPAAIDSDYYPFGLWGYINKTGEFVIKPQFDSASGFVDGYAIVSKKDREYTLEEISNGSYDTEQILIDRDLNTYTCDDDNLKGLDFSEGPQLKFDKKTGAPGYVDSKGNWVIKPNKNVNMPDSETMFFSGGMLAFVKDSQIEDESVSLYGFVNERGKKVIPAEFCKILMTFHDGVALVASPAKKDGEKAQYGYINKKGKYLIEKEYTFDLSDLSLGMW